MINYLFAPENSPFTTAILVMFGILFLEIFGGVSILDSLIQDFDADGDFDADTNIAHGGGFISWC